jgi:hypothetical protein
MYPPTHRRPWNAAGKQWRSTIANVRRACLAVVLIVAAALGVGTPSYANNNAADGFARLAKRDFVQAQSELAFGMKVPHPAPTGFRLVRVNWIGSTQVTLGWQRPSDNAYVQAWETSLTADELGTKGALLPSSTTVGAKQWLRTVGGLCTERHPCLTRRFPDGVLVELSGMPSERGLTRIASALR